MNFGVILSDVDPETMLNVRPEAKRPLVVKAPPAVPKRTGPLPGPALRKGPPPYDAPTLSSSGSSSEASLNEEPEGDSSQEEQRHSASSAAAAVADSSEGDDWVLPREVAEQGAMSSSTGGATRRDLTSPIRQQKISVRYVLPWS